MGRERGKGRGRHRRERVGKQRKILDYIGGRVGWLFGRNIHFGVRT